MWNSLPWNCSVSLKRNLIVPWQITFLNIYNVFTGPYCPYSYCNLPLYINQSVTLLICRGGIKAWKVYMYLVVLTFVVLSVTWRKILLLTELLLAESSIQFIQNTLWFIHWMLVLLVHISVVLQKKSTFFSSGCRNSDEKSDFTVSPKTVTWESEGTVLYIRLLCQISFMQIWKQPSHAKCCRHLMGKKIRKKKVKPSPDICL